MSSDTSPEFVHLGSLVSREAESCRSPGVDTRHYPPGLRIVKCKTNFFKSQIESSAPLVWDSQGAELTRLSLEHLYATGY